MQSRALLSWDSNSCTASAGVRMQPAEAPDAEGKPRSAGCLVSKSTSCDGGAAAWVGPCVCSSNWVKQMHSSVEECTDVQLQRIGGLTADKLWGSVQGPRHAHVETTYCAGALDCQSPRILSTDQSLLHHHRKRGVSPHDLT